MQKTTQTFDLFKSVIKQEKAALDFGFYWDDVDQLLRQIKSESEELTEAYNNNDSEGIKEELGDLLLASLNLCIFLNQDPHEILQRSIEKMQRRYDTMVTLVKQDGLENLINKPMDVKLAYWKKAKEYIKYYETDKK